MKKFKERATRCTVLLACCALVAATKPTTQTATVNARAYGDGDNIDPAIAKSLEATPITLHVENVSALAAMTELAKVSGYTIKPGYDQWFNQSGSRAGKVTITANAQPFWAVFRDICAHGNVNVYWGGDESRTIQLIPGNFGGEGMMRAAVSIQGPFLVALSNVERENTVNMSDPKTAHRTIHIQVQAFTEPKTILSMASYQPVVDEATDDNGNTMMPAPQAGNDNNMQSSRGIASYGSIDLPYPTTNPGTHIAKLKGHIDARMQVSSDKWEIADPLNPAGASKTVGTKNVRLEPLTKDGNRYFLQIIFERGDEDQQTFFQTMNQGIHITATDASGKNSGLQYQGWSGADKTATKKFALDGGFVPAKLMIDLPGDAKKISIPFELLNVPLP